MNRRLLAALAGFAGFAVCIYFFYEIGAYYDDWFLPYATGMDVIDARELGVFLWLHALGGAAALCLAAGLYYTSWPDRVHAAIARAGAQPKKYLPLLALFCVGAAVLVHCGLLRGAPLSVDDNIYIFGAKTLAKGRLVNPLPGDSEFFHEALLIQNDAGWWSKFPIGHPLLLALGEVLHVRFLIVPLVTALCAVLTFLLARRVIGPSIAWAAALLLATSPQFITTGATSMSQPASCAAMLAAYLFTERALERRTVRDALLAGACLGYGILVRPLPGVLFAVGAGGYWLASLSVPLRERLRLFGMAALPLAGFGALFLAINYLQTGGLFETGYDVAHGGLGLTVTVAAGSQALAISVGSALLRFGCWFLGWPAGLCIAVLAWQRKWLLGWIFVGCEVLYRVIARKTGLSPTGPIYVYEAVPLLVVFVAAGVSRLGSFARPDLSGDVRRALRAGVIGLVAANLFLFWPVQLENLSRSAAVYRRPTDELAERGVQRALIFANHMIAPGLGQSWVTTPPPPAPDFSDDYLFVRMPEKADAADRALSFWKRRFPDRRAFVFQYRNGRPSLWEIKSRADFEKPPW